MCVHAHTQYLTHLFQNIINNLISQVLGMQLKQDRQGLCLQELVF